MSHDLPFGKVPDAELLAAMKAESRALKQVISTLDAAAAELDPAGHSARLPLRPAKLPVKIAGQ